MSPDRPEDGDLIDKAGGVYDAAERLSEPLRTPWALMVLGWAVAIVFVLAVAAFLNRGTSSPARPQLLPADAGVPSAKVKGFDEVAVRVHSLRQRGGAVASRAECDLLASTPGQQARGLMEMKDLAGYDGMVFAFAGETTTPFYMRDTPIPLSIAWFDGHGVYLGSANMSPCGNLAGCPLTQPPGLYRLAIEVPAGSLARLGLVPGSAITVGGPCPISA